MRTAFLFISFLSLFSLASIATAQQLVVEERPFLPGVDIENSKIVSIGKCGALVGVTTPPSNSPVQIFSWRGTKTVKLRGAQKKLLEYFNRVSSRSPAVPRGLRKLGSQNFALSGFGSGGHLVGLYTNSPDGLGNTTAPRGIFLTNAARKRVKFTVPPVGVTTFLTVTSPNARGSFVGTVLLQDNRTVPFIYHKGKVTVLSQVGMETVLLQSIDARGNGAGAAFMQVTNSLNQLEFRFVPVIVSRSGTIKAFPELRRGLATHSLLNGTVLGNTFVQCETVSGSCFARVFAITKKGIEYLDANSGIPAGVNLTAVDTVSDLGEIALVARDNSGLKTSPLLFVPKGVAHNKGKRGC